MKKNSTSLLLMEMALAILFFALSAAVILQVYVGAHRRSTQSETVVTATLLSEDAVNALRASDLPTDAFFADDGYMQTETGYEKQIILNDKRYVVMFTTAAEQTGTAGSLFLGEVSVMFAGETLHTMDAGRYISGGVLP